MTEPGGREPADCGDRQTNPRQGKPIGKLTDRQAGKIRRHSERENTTNDRAKETEGNCRTADYAKRSGARAEYRCFTSGDVAHCPFNFAERRASSRYACPKHASHGGGRLFTELRQMLARVNMILDHLLKAFGEPPRHDPPPPDSCQPLEQEKQGGPCECGECEVESQWVPLGSEQLFPKFG